jgi:threonine aldolase
MVYVTVGDANAAVAQLAAAGVACNAVAVDCLRLVTHLDIDDAAVDQALSAFSALPR